ALEHGHARIVPQRPVQLAVTDVERHDLRRAAAQQHVGEAPRRGADVERAASRDVDAKRVERMRELHAASADVRMIRDDERDVGGAAAASFPAVLPRSADAPSTSRMSSTIWNARPSSAEYFAIASSAGASAPAMMAPAAAAALISAPVFFACIARRPSASNDAPRPAASRSIA